MRLVRSYAILVAFCAMLEGCGMNTRKQFIREGFGLAAIVATQTAPAILVRSMCAARNGIAAAKRGGGWVNPYVTNGLVATWDGEWNAGWGVHDANATVWKDLVGTRDATLSGSFAWGSNYWHVESVSGRGLATWPAQNLGSDQTIEFVISVGATSGYGRIIAEGQNVAAPIARTNGPYLYGYGIDRGITLSDYVMDYMHVHQIVHPSGGPLYYYIDGALVWTEPGATSDSTGATSGYFANRADLQRGLDAKYYSVRLYSRALTAAEIAANYAVDKARFNLL